MQDFRDKTAVITGAAGGIGRALATLAATEGMCVVLADIYGAALDAAAADLKGKGAKVLAVRTDVRSAESVAALADRAVAAFGKIHLVCNNAGVAFTGPVWEGDLRDWEWILGANLWGVIHGVRTFTPILLAQDEESWIVNTASAFGVTSPAGYGAYNVSKHGVVALTETLERDLRKIGAKVRAAVLLPGPVDTGIIDSYRKREGAPANTDLAALEGRRRLLAAGLPPDRVARMVFDAVRADRFYIPTHPDELRGMVQERAENILEDRRPT
jgi:NAD(P)-dependent dehydrogenase (short-subunit alcohol dehydrogenase family)